MYKFEAKCSKCSYTFFAPSLGDLAYGEKILNTVDGQEYRKVSAFDSFPQRLSQLLPEKYEKNYWDFLASFADLVDGKRLIANLVCPSCHSEKMKYWQGCRFDEEPIEIASATFSSSNDLPDAEIIKRFL